MQILDSRLKESDSAFSQDGPGIRVDSKTWEAGLEALLLDMSMGLGQQWR